MGYVKNFFILVGLFLISQISMFIYSLAKGFSVASGAEHLSLLSVIILILFIIGNIWLLLFLGKKLGFVDLNFHFFSMKNVLIIIGGAFLARIIAVGGTLLLNNQGTESTANDAAIQMIFTGENPLLIFLLVGISAPIMEEIVFRGGIINLWLKKVPIVGVAVSAIVFGLVHGPTNLISFLIYGLTGLILALAYYMTERLEVSIAIHFLNNFIPALVLAMGLL
ncbi:CPBP family intramembrane metalloprotease [Erwinia sp. CPCC 100877]|nr:CPBP family intramembrane metalloprotease [Erwinia sp. CPCC 100877]